MSGLLRYRWAPWAFALGLATLGIGAPAAQLAAAAECNTDAIWTQAEQSFPDYDVGNARYAGGVVTLVLSRRDPAGAFAIGLRSAGGFFFTSVLAMETDTAQSAERARVGEVIAGWDALPAVQKALEQCGAGVSLSTADAETSVRSAAAAALGDVRLGDLGEARIEIGALLLSLGLVLLPIRKRPRTSIPRSAVEWCDLGILLGIAVAAVAVALAVAWRLAPETDEVVTLGTRHQPLSSLLAWYVGGEPFNPPGTSILFALWLRVADGFFPARLLSIALIPATVWMAYRAGLGVSGRFVGLAFATLVVLSPAYLRLAAIARGYTLIVFAICAILAAVARTERGSARGAAVGLACVVSVWVSYLLWPLAFAAPWIARLDRRDRVRLTAALGVMAAALAPRIINGIATSATKTDVFELRGPADVLGYALTSAGQAAPAGFRDSNGILWLAGGIATVLIAAAIVQLRRHNRRRLLTVSVAVVLVIVPVLALLGGGRGIRERHVIGIQAVLALLVAMGLGQMIASANGATRRALGGLLLVTLAVLSACGDTALVQGARGWVDQLARICSGADLLVIVPRSVQMPVHAMLTGDSPLGSTGMRWPPVCETDTEWWCRRVGGLSIVSVDAVTDDLVASAADVPRSIWIFSESGEEGDRGIPPPLQHCEALLHVPLWRVLQCSGITLRRG